MQKTPPAPEHVEDEAKGGGLAAALLLPPAVLLLGEHFGNQKVAWEQLLHKSEREAQGREASKQFGH